MDPKLTGLSRRGLLAVGAGVAAGATLAACGDGDDSAASSDSSPSKASDGGSAGLVPLEEVPVGGAVSATGKDGRPVIVAQPRSGDVVAFSAVCTHRGCTVAPGEDALECPCHGSTFDLATGENTGGPAPRPLAALRVRVVDGVVEEG